MATVSEWQKAASHTKSSSRPWGKRSDKEDFFFFLNISEGHLLRKVTISTQPKKKTVMISVKTNSQCWGHSSSREHVSNGYVELMLFYVNEYNGLWRCLWIYSAVIQPKSQMSYFTACSKKKGKNSGFCYSNTRKDRNKLFPIKAIIMWNCKTNRHGEVYISKLKCCTLGAR